MLVVTGGLNVVLQVHGVSVFACSRCCVVGDTPSSLVCRFVQILAEETDASVCDLPSASSPATLAPTTSSAQTHTASGLIGLLTPTPPPAAPSAPLPNANETLVIDPLQVRPAEASGSLPLFVVGTLFLIIGASLVVIAIVILVQHRQSCAQQARRDIENGKHPEPPNSKLELPLDDHTPVSPSSSLNSSDVEALQIGTVPQNESDIDDDVMRSDSPSQVNGHIHHSRLSSETGGAIDLVDADLTSSYA